jgi:hypothetical protein
MIESYKQAIEEFKRVDHLFYVSLKYTRTVDIMRSVIERLIATFENSIDALLKCMKEEKQIVDIPDNPVGKAMIVKENDKDNDIQKYLDLYLMLRKIMRLEYSKREEFRRHVTMTVEYNEEPFEINIDVLEEYYNQTKKYLNYIKSRVECYRE